MLGRKKSPDHRAFIRSHNVEFARIRSRISAVAHPVCESVNSAIDVKAFSGKLINRLVIMLALDNGKIPVSHPVVVLGLYVHDSLLDLIVKSSHSAASIDRVPASHCCQLRWVRCTSADAAAVESPAAVRAARTCSGVGLSTTGGLEGASTVLMSFVPKDLIAGIICANFVDSAVLVVLGKHRFDGSGILNHAAGAKKGDFIGFHDQSLIDLESPASSRSCRISDGDGLEVISRTVTVDKVLFAMRFIGFYQLIEGLIPSILIAMNKRILLGYKLVQMMTFLTVFSVLSGLHDLLRFVGGLRCATHGFTIESEQRSRKSYFASNENKFARAA